jgi:hypothetical protein
MWRDDPERLAASLLNSRLILPLDLFPNLMLCGNEEEGVDGYA